MSQKPICLRQTGQRVLARSADGSVTVSLPITIKRRRGRTIARKRGDVTANSTLVDHDITPIQLALARGHRWPRKLEDGRAKSLRKIAGRKMVDNSYVSRMVNLTLLASDIVTAIVDGRLPEGLSLFDLAVDMPAGREAQREGLGSGR